MKYTFLAAAMLLSLALAGCGDSYDSIADDTMGIMEDMIDILAGIESKEDAEKAVPRMEALAEKMQAIAKRAEELGQPTEQEAEDVSEAMQKKMEDVMGRYMQEMMRVSQIPEAMEYLEGAMEKVNPGR
jgi:hypothetical protein